MVGVRPQTDILSNHGTGLDRYSHKIYIYFVQKGIVFIIIIQCLLILIKTIKESEIC